MKTHLCNPVVIMGFLLLCSSALSQEVSLTPYLGIKKDFLNTHQDTDKGETYKYYKPGPVIGVDLNYILKPRLGLGVNVSFSRWKAHEDWLEILDFLVNPDNATEKSVDGHQSFIEIIPQLRIKIIDKNPKVYLHGGLYTAYIYTSEIILETSFSSGSNITVTLDDEGYVTEENYYTSGGFTHTVSGSSGFTADPNRLVVGGQFGIIISISEWLYISPKLNMIGSYPGLIQGSLNVGINLTKNKKAE